MLDCVSYVITVYNKAACLPDLVAALVAQVGDFDREYIFVDDESTDGSLQILQDLCKNIPEAIILSQKNTGPSAANNRGIEASTKKWIFFVDGDDYLVPKATQTLLNLAREHDVKICRGGFSNDLARETHVFDGKVTIFDDLMTKALRFYPMGCGVLVARELVLASGGFDERVFIQDYSIALRLALVSHKMVLINDLVAANIDKNQQRLSGNKTQEHYDTALARYLFVQDHLDIEYRYKYLALERQLKKSWSWYRKQWFIPRVFSKYFLRYLITRFDFNYQDELILKWMSESLEVYNKSVIRVIAR